MGDSMAIRYEDGSGAHYDIVGGKCVRSSDKKAIGMNEWEVERRIEIKTKGRLAAIWIMLFVPFAIWAGNLIVKVL